MKTATRTRIKYAKHRGENEYAAQLELQLEHLEENLRPYYHVSGFAHPKLLVFANDKPMEPQAFEWGLIPGWAKTKKDAKDIANKTLNARGETIFDKPSFRGPAKNRRCIIYLDAFYEHHHANGRPTPST